MAAVVVAATAAMLLEPCLPATAARSAPAPTLRISTSLAGRALPASGISGAWSVARRAATLDLHGYTVTGSTTSVQAVWTSRWLSTRPRRPVLDVQVDDGHWVLAPGMDASSWQYRLEARTVGGRWRRVPGGVVTTEPAEPLARTGSGAATSVIALRRVEVQLRVTFRAQTRDTAQAGLSLAVRTP